MIKKRFISLLVLLAAVVTGAVAQSITIDPAFLTLDAGEHTGLYDVFLPITYENISDENGENFYLQFCTAEGVEIETQTMQMWYGPAYYATTSPWCFATVTKNTDNDTYQVSVGTMSNNGEARSVYFKVYAYEDPMIQADPVYSNLATVTQAGATYTVTANLANGAYWATFYTEAGNYQASSGTQVFAVTLTGTAIEMTEIPNRIALSGKGVVLKNTTTGSITMTKTVTAPDVDYSGSSLTGTMTSITNPSYGNIYVLNNDTYGVGFYKLQSDGTIGANKAYLTYSGGGAAPAREFFLFDEATGIEMPTVEDVNADAVVYDLQGRRVQNPTKGLYIVNGKKVFINK